VKKTNLLVKIVIIGIVLAGAIALYRNYYPFDWRGYGGYHMGRGMGFMMPFIWILLIAVVVSLLNRTTRDTLEHGNPFSKGPDAVELLKQRYAKSEIDKTEFRSKMEDIRNIS
jgi:putative membrane protein